MDLIYSTTWNENPLNSTLGHSGIISCAWSCTNLLAFTSERKIKGFSDKFLHIVDPNQPWDIYTTAIKSSSITSLQWNQMGTKLLSIDACGSCVVWTMVNYLTNVWMKKNNLNSDLHGEDILSSSWLHNGKKVIFHADKFDNASEKFKRSNIQPSVTQLGGQPMEGYIAVTGSGRVFVKVVTHDDETVVINDCLNYYPRNYLSIADIGFSGQGIANPVIMATDGSVDSCIHFWCVKLEYDNDSSKLSIKVDVLPAINLKCRLESPQYDQISHVQFVSRENSDHVLICVSGSTGSMIESWLFKREQELQIHSLFLQLPNPTTEKRARWQHIKNSSALPRVLNFSISPIPIRASLSATKAMADNKFYCGTAIAVALADNTIQMLHRLNLASLMSIQLPEILGSQEVRIGKRTRTTEYRSSLRYNLFSPTSCALAVFDDHAGLLMYKIAPWFASKVVPGEPLVVRHLAHLLHCCTIIGYECWDILLHMHIRILKSVCEQLTKDYSQQSAPLQQMLQWRLLSVKIAIFQSFGIAEAVDCHLRLLFNAITVVFRSLLRPPQDSSDEQAPAEKLHEVCSTSFETDITKLLQCVDTDTQTLQSLQQLIQWITDVTLYLLSIVPHMASPNIPGISLLCDKTWLSTLRELLVIIQTWGLLKSACSPVFCGLDDQVDCLPHIFKLVTKVWHAVSRDEGRNLPDDVVDECCLLSNQILIPSLDIIHPVDGVLQKLNAILPPYKFIFGQKPRTAVHPQRFSNLELIRPSENTGKIDNLRRIFLGNRPVATIKQCSRCGIISVLNPAVNPTLAFWDQRFIRVCLCGGRWRKIETTKKAFS